MSTNVMDIEINAVYRNHEAGFDVRAVPNPDHRGEPGDRFVVQTRVDVNTPWERPLDRCSDADSACKRVAACLTWTRSPHSR
jgi:hypothetical protein